MTDSWVPLAAIGGIVLVATRAYQNSKNGTGIGLGGGGSGFGINVWQFLFGADPGDEEGKEGGGGAAKPSGPSDKPGGTGGSASEPGDGDGKAGDGQDKPDGGKGGKDKPQGGSSPGDNDGKGTSGGDGGGGVGGGSGGGIGSGSSSGSGHGDLDQGGSQGVDDGGGENDGYYDYDPFEGKIIDVDLPPPDLSEQMLDKVRETVRTLVNGSIIDPGASPDAAERLPPEIHFFDTEKGDLLRFWADVALHYNYDLPWGRLDDTRDSHKPWIELWVDTLAYTTMYEAEENGGFGDDIPTTTITVKPVTVRRRGMGDVGAPLLLTREVFINPFIRTVAEAR